MRVPMSWLAELVDLPPGTTADDVAAALVAVGLEEEGIERAGADVRGPLVVGRVLSFADEPQSNGKTIRWCSVDVGEPEPRGIVCGAHNFAVDDKVVVSLPGAVLAGGFAISARKTYGHVSDGMICSARELGLGDDHAGIIVLSRLGLDPALGEDAVPLLGLRDDVVEVNVNPDRGYCLSVRGVARELAGSLGVAFRDPAGAVDVPAVDGLGHPVRIDDLTGADRIVLRTVEGLDPAAPTPAWMQRRLQLCGMRSVSLAVDVTNYVMLELGQPLHAYDGAALRGTVVVRRAAPGDRIETIDHTVHALDPDDVLITDDSGPIGVAGTMGGLETEISGTSTEVVLEAAHFTPTAVAAASRRHRLVSEASKRFERGVDPALTDVASARAAGLLVTLGGARLVGSVADGVAAAPRPVRMAADLPSRLVGLDLPRAEVVAALRTVGAEVAEQGHDLVVTPPTWRPDLVAGADLVEEVARLHGYDTIPSVLPSAPPGRGLTKVQRARRSVGRALAEQGYVEVLSYPFVPPEVHDAFGLAADDPRRRALRLANPLSAEAPELRTSLLAPLLETLRRNVGRGTKDCAVFEIGLVVRPERTDVMSPRPPTTSRPGDDEVAAIEASVPHQPLRLAVALCGDRVPPGPHGPGVASGWQDAVTAARTVAATLGVVVDVRADADHLPWHPGRCAVLEVGGELVGHAGELHPRAVAALGLPPRTCVAELDLDVLVAAAPDVVPAAPLSTYPVATQDVALVVAADVPAADVEAALVAGAGPLLEAVRLFDVYTGDQVGPGRKSLAYALRLRAPDRTLTADEASEARDAAVAEAGRRVGAELRGG